MSGGYYIALSGMRTQINQLDRLSEDLANSATSGFKSERTSYETAKRPSFESAMETAIDVTLGERKLDTRPGNITPTGRNLDVAVQADGFLKVQTPQGERYTRNGHLMRTLEGTLITREGSVVMGEDGPIKIEGKGDITVAPTLIEEGAVVKTGALEDSNVSVVERLSELTNVSRQFQSLQKALSVMMNDVDGRSIDSLGRR
jgi:flagellar basal-body rod protein FlgF